METSSSLKNETLHQTAHRFVWACSKGELTRPSSIGRMVFNLGRVHGWA